MEELYNKFLDVCEDLGNEAYISKLLDHGSGVEDYENPKEFIEYFGERLDKANALMEEMKKLLK
jgi:hypothetical protein